MNTRIFTSVLSILAVVGAVSATTYALFSDEATSTANVFAAGELNLQLDDVNETSPTETVTASLGGTNFVPGSSVSGFISLHNEGQTPIDKIIFGSTQTTATDGLGGSSNLANVINLALSTGDNNTCTGGTDITGTVATEVGDGVSPLTLMELTNEDYDALPGLAVNDEDYFLCVTATMDSAASNAYQGDSVTHDFTFMATQGI